MLGIILLLAALAFSIYKYQQYKNKEEDDVEITPVDTRTPLEIASERLVKLYENNLYKKEQPKEHYIILSEIIKGFLGQLYHENMVEMTTTELCNACQKKLNVNLFQKLKNILLFSDTIKFAKILPSKEDHLEQKKKAFDLMTQIWKAEQKISESYQEDPLS